MKFLLFALLLGAASAKQLRNSGKNATALGNQQTALMSKLGSMFRTYDANQNGLLDPVELTQALNTMGDDAEWTDLARRMKHGLRKVARRDVLSLEKAKMVTRAYSHFDHSVANAVLAGKGSSGGSSSTPSPPPPAPADPVCHAWEGKVVDGNGCKCENVRKDFNSLSEKGKKFWQDAMQAASDAGIFSNYADIHFRQEYYAHSVNFFLPWHRRFLLAFEEAVRKLDGYECFSLVYWDWAEAKSDCPPESASNQQQAQCRLGDMFEFTGGRSTAMGAGHYGQAATMHGHHSNMIENWVYHGNNVERLTMEDYQAYNVADESDVSLLVDQGTFAEMRTLLEQYHNTPHCSVLGDMCSMKSPQDPLFYAHHAQIDRIWNFWQICHGLTECDDESSSWDDEAEGKQSKEALASQGHAEVHNFGCSHVLRFDSTSGQLGGAQGPAGSYGPSMFTDRQVGQKGFQMVHADGTGSYEYGPDQFNNNFLNLPQCQGSFLETSAGEKIATEVGLISKDELWLTTCPKHQIPVYNAYKKKGVCAAKKEDCKNNGFSLKGKIGQKWCQVIEKIKKPFGLQPVCKRYTQKGKRVRAITDTCSAEFLKNGCKAPKSPIENVKPWTAWKKWANKLNPFNKKSCVGSKCCGPRSTWNGKRCVGAQTRSKSYEKKKESTLGKFFGKLG